MSGFHGAFATGVASQQGTLTLPDTWFRPPFWDLLMLQLAPIVETKFLELAMSLLDFSPRIPLGTFSILLTKLDARTGYWTLKLAEDSSFLTTFNTPYGRYRFLRLPIGLKSSQDEFQRKIDESYEEVEGMIALVDDILLYGKSREEHDKNLKAVLERSRLS